MTASLTPDLCVIGAGPAGLSVAMGAAALNVPVVLIEKDEMDGQRLHRGSASCEALIAAGRTAHVMRSAERFGITPCEPLIDYAQTRRHIRDVLAKIAPNFSVARLEAMNVKVIHAAAHFTSKTTVEAGDATIRAHRFVVATGSSPASLPIPGLEQIRSITPESILELETLPSRLIVVGTQGESVELAQAFRRLGSEVTILESGKALAEEDPELADILLIQLAREGIVLREKVEFLRVEPRGTGVRVILSGKTFEESVDGSHLLVAAGRVPNVDGLGLKTAGVAFDKRGIKLGRNLRSSNRRIYAVGGAAGAPCSVHAARYQAAVVLRTSLMHLPVRFEATAVPRVRFTDPEIAVVGLCEEDARRRYGSVRIARWPFAENDRAQAERVPSGHIKVILSKWDTVVGVGIVGPHAGELIGVWQIAISKALKVSDMASLTMPYPTYSEVSQYAAIGAATWHRPWTNRLMRWIRRCRFG